MEKLSLAEVLLVAAEWLAEPENSEKEKKFNEIKERTIVKTFLPLRHKIALIEKVITDVSVFPDYVSDFTTAYELTQTYDILLAYTNVGYDFSPDLYEYNYYDVLWASGYCDYIIEFCRRDYERTLAMVDRMMNYMNLQKLVGAISSIDMKSIDDLNKRIDETVLKIDPKTIEKISQIVRRGNNQRDEFGEAITEVIKENIAEEDSAEENE